MRPWPRYLASIVAQACLGLLLITGIGLGCWYARGGRLLTVQTGSMVPQFKPGDAIIDQPVRYDQLQLGQIVSYRSTANRQLIISHRIISINKSDGKFQTKGDNLSQADLPISGGQLVGQVTSVAPHLGAVLHWLRRPIGLLLIVYLPAVLTVITEINRFLRRPAYSYYRLQSR